MRVLGMGVALDESAVARYLTFMNDLSPERTNKFKAYRARKKAAGLKEVRRWVWDVNSPEFKEQLRREAEILNAAPGESETMDFIEGVMADTMKDDPC